MKVLLVGPYPPPAGGIATQIFELQKLLTDRNINCEILDIRQHQNFELAKLYFIIVYTGWIFKLSYFAYKGYIIHLVTNGHNFKSWLTAFLCSVAGSINRRKTIVTFGSGLLPDYINKIKYYDRFIIKYTARLASLIILRNSECTKALTSAGIASEKIRIVSGFLGIDHIKSNTLPGDIRKFVKNHSPIIGAHVREGPEYGIPLLLKGIYMLKEQYPNAGLILYGAKSEAIEKEKIFSKVKQYVCFSGFIPHEVAVTLIKSFSVFVRATYYDGDSNSIREAMSLGIPCVASSTDFRPEGVQLFEIGNLEKMVSKIKYTLNHLNELRVELNSNKSAYNGAYEKLYALYEGLG